MKLKMKTNLGSRDAAKVGLTYQECTEGKVIDVNDDAASELIARGYALPEEIKAVPSTTLIRGK